MILLGGPLQTTLYRALTPRWAMQPTSGAGAAKVGARFNRPGVSALYLSQTPATALQEYQQTSPFLPPCTLCSYAAQLDGLVDLRQLSNGAAWDELWHDWRDDWRHTLLELHIEPPTWVLSDLVREAGHRGIIFPSMLVPDGVNVVVYTDRLDAGTGNWVKVLDPDQELPKNQDSWKGK